MQPFLLSLFILATFGASQARGEFRQINLTIFGMDWGICAHAVSVAIKRIAGIESVTVSLNKGTATIQLKPGSSVSLEQIVLSVKNNGFTPKEAKVTALGEVLYLGGKLQLKIAGHNYEVETQAAKTSEELKNRAGQMLLVEGMIPPSKDKKPAMLIHVKSFIKNSGLWRYGNEKVVAGFGAHWTKFDNANRIN